MPMTTPPSCTPVFPARERVESCRRMDQYWYSGPAITAGAMRGNRVSGAVRRLQPSIAREARGGRVAPGRPCPGRKGA
eukprot:2717765-Pyramimonas_sp.AAC.1